MLQAARCIMRALPLPLHPIVVRGFRASRHAVSTRTWIPHSRPAVPKPMSTPCLTSAFLLRSERAERYAGLFVVAAIFTSAVAIT
jgi:hypothetical protein